MSAHHMLVLIRDLALADAYRDSIHELLVSQVNIDEPVKCCEVAHFADHKLC